MDEDWSWRKWFHVVKNDRDAWKIRCEVATLIAGFSILCNLWQYYR